MKIRINRSVLADALAEVLPFVGQKSPILILKNVKITTKGNRVKFEANNQQASIRSYVEAIEIDQDGSFVVDCADITSFVARCKGDEITLITDSDTLTVNHSKGGAQFQTMRVEEYPDFDMPTDKITEANIPGALLRDCINVAKAFVGTADLRPQMKPIYAYVKNGEFGYCATDTRKMATDHMSVANVDGVDVNWFIEPAVFSALSKSCANVDTVIVKVSPTHVSYRVGNTIIQTLQTKGNFPDFKRVIPATWGMECAVDKAELLDSLRRTALQCEENRLVKLNITQMDMTVTADNLTKLKKSSEQLQHNGCNGEIKIGMQVDYLMTCLGACASNEVVLRITDPARPMLIHQADKPNAVVLLMPMVVTN